MYERFEPPRANRRPCSKSERTRMSCSITNYNFMWISVFIRAAAEWKSCYDNCRKPRTSLTFISHFFPSIANHMRNNVALLCDNFEWNSHAFMEKFRSRDFSLSAIDTLKNSAHFSSPLFALFVRVCSLSLRLLLLQWAPSERDPAIKTSTTARFALHFINL